WTIAPLSETQAEKIRHTVNTGRAICALSGGVDSAAAAALAYRAIRDQLTCIFVDHGLLRQGEPEQVIQTFRGSFQMPLVHVDARDRFLRRLAGIVQPEQKAAATGEAPLP